MLHLTQTEINLHPVQQPNYPEQPKPLVQMNQHIRTSLFFSTPNLFLLFKKINHARSSEFAVYLRICAMYTGRTKVIPVLKTIIHTFNLRMILTICHISLLGLLPVCIFFSAGDNYAPSFVPSIFFFTRHIARILRPTAINNTCGLTGIAQVIYELNDEKSKALKISPFRQTESRFFQKTNRIVIPFPLQLQLFLIGITTIYDRSQHYIYLYFIYIYYFFSKTNC